MRPSCGTPGIVQKVLVGCARLKRNSSLAEAQTRHAKTANELLQQLTRLKFERAKFAARVFISYLSTLVSIAELLKGQ